jgi:hypothetical protein
VGCLGGYVPSEGGGEFGREVRNGFEPCSKVTSRLGSFP